MSRKTRTTLAAGLVLGTSLCATACAQGNAQNNASVPPAVIEITKTQNPTVFIGEGRLPHAPEYIEFQVTIESECHATPMEASKAADDAAANVMKTLRSTLDPDNDRDGVFSKGGYTRSFERYLGNSRTVCRGTYAKTVTLTAKTSRIAEFQARFSDIQHDLLAGSLSKPSDSSAERGITFATLSEPTPQLYYETREKLEQQALADALGNARAKLEATAAAGCSTGDYQILRMVETGVDDGRPIAYARTSAPSNDDTMELDSIWINKLLQVSFIAPGRCTGTMDGGKKG